MSYMFANNRVRPSKLKGAKNKKYHSDYAKFCLSTMDNYIYRRYINRCLVSHIESKPLEDQLYEISKIQQ